MLNVTPQTPHSNEIISSLPITGPATLPGRRVVDRFRVPPEQADLIAYLAGFNVEKRA